MNDSEVNKDNSGGNDNTGELMNEATAHVHTSEWLGAIIRYLFFLGYRDFKYYYNSTKRQYRLNVFVGWLFKLILFIGFFIFMMLVNN